MGERPSVFYGIIELATGNYIMPNDPVLVYVSFPVFPFIEWQRCTKILEGLPKDTHRISRIKILPEFEDKKANG